MFRKMSSFLAKLVWRREAMGNWLFLEPFLANFAKLVQWLVAIHKWGWPVPDGWCRDEIGERAPPPTIYQGLPSTTQTFSPNRPQNFTQAHQNLNGSKIFPRNLLCLTARLWGGGCFLHTILFLVPISVVKADFLKANRKAVSKRLIRLLKGCYM